MLANDLWPGRGDHADRQTLKLALATASAPPPVAGTFTVPQGIWLASVLVEAAVTTRNEQAAWTGVIGYYTATFTAQTPNRLRSSTALSVMLPQADGTALANPITGLTVSDPDTAGLVSVSIAWGTSSRAFNGNVVLTPLRVAPDDFLIATPPFIPA